MEQSFVAWAKMRAHRLKQPKLGVGDDAAILAAIRNGDTVEDVVVTTDSLLDGVHFRTEEVSPRQIGRKAVLVNLSDLAAMGARPQAFFLSLCLPQSERVDAMAAEIFEGVCEVAEEFGIAVAGGDTNCWPGPLVVHGTAVGQTVQSEVWLRNGVQAEDLVVVTGPLGGSIEGKHLEFKPRFDVVEKLRGKSLVHAALDITDGLSTDLLRVCDASHCGAILDLDCIPVTEAARSQAANSGRSPAEHALGDGEDFELLLAIAPEDFEQCKQLVEPESLYACGVFTTRTGLWQKQGGKILQLTATGYTHDDGC